MVRPGGILVLVCFILSDRKSLSQPSVWCPVPPPCTCYGWTIDCGNQNLTAFPSFNVSNITGDVLYIRMEGNFLKTVPENTFENLKLANGTETHVYLQHNNLSHIDANAFNGLAGTIIYLRLDYNDLTGMPSELTKLTNLETLYLRNNPLVSLDTDTMQTLSKRLNVFQIGMDYFRQWPDQLKYLNNLTELDIYGLDLPKLDINAFDGFGTTLQTLAIVNSSLSQIPASLCHLHKMETFEFYNNYNIQIDRFLFEPCSENMTSVLFVTLSNNELRRMPPVFNAFPSMTSLFLNNNELSSIPLEYIPDSSALQLLNLENNTFTSIPAAFAKLASLEQLQFGYNKLRSIEKDDLSGMVNLKYLYLYVNPLEYIASTAFRNNNNLYTLALGSTKLHHLPASLIGLNKLHYFTVGDDPIVCSCEMSYLKPWNVTLINMDGNCESTTIPIKQFLLEELPKCP